MTIVPTAMVPIVAMVVIVAIGVAYMIYLAATWAQFQRDRASAFARVDEILDRISAQQAVPVPVEVPVETSDD